MDILFQPANLRIRNESMYYVYVNEEIIKLIQTRAILKINLTEYNCPIHFLSSDKVKNIRNKLECNNKLLIANSLHMLGKYARVEFKVI